MGASNGGLGGVYGGGGIQPQPPSGGGTRGFDVMPRRVPAALGNFGPKSGPANNPGGGWSGGVAAPTPIATPNPIGGQIPGYTPPPGWGNLPTDGGGERPVAAPNGPGFGPGTPMPMPPTGPVSGSPGYDPPSPGGGERPVATPNGPVASPGPPMPMPPTGPGFGPINDPGDPTPPGTGGSSGGNVTGPRPSRFPMPQPKMPRRTDVNFYKPPQTLQPQPAKDPTGGATDPRRTAPIYVRPKFK